MIIIIIIMDNDNNDDGDIVAVDYHRHHLNDGADNDSNAYNQPNSSIARIVHFY